MQRYLVLFAVLLGLSACETVGGMGRDLESAGDAIEDTAAETESRM
jgi:predicted small secreted protein